MWARNEKQPIKLEWPSTTLLLHADHMTFRCLDISGDLITVSLEQLPPLSDEAND